MLFFFFFFLLFSVRKRNQTGYNTGVPNISGGVAQFGKSFNIEIYIYISFNKKKIERQVLIISCSCKTLHNSV